MKMKLQEREKDRENTREGFQNAGSSLPRTKFQECLLKSLIFVCFVLFSLFLFPATKIILNDPLDNKWGFHRAREQYLGLCKSYVQKFLRQLEIFCSFHSAVTLRHVH